MDGSPIKERESIMANPNFIATMSSNEIWRDLDDTRCITDDLDAIEADILALETDKADANHTHSDYAPASHTHPDYAYSEHTHEEYSQTSNEHSGYAASTHTHNYSDLTHPEMLFGVEYLTNEKWNGENLYTVLIDCGNFSDGTNVDTDIVCRYVVRHCGRIGWSSVPIIHNTLENPYSCWVEVSNHNGHIRVIMRGGTSVGSVPVQIQVWYTKLTN